MPRFKDNFSTLFPCLQKSTSVPFLSQKKKNQVHTIITHVFKIQISIIVISKRSFTTGLLPSAFGTEPTRTPLPPSACPIT